MNLIVRYRSSTRISLPMLQVTLVDCPGHASLIRTVIGGAQIIDMMLLVVDVTKGKDASRVAFVASRTPPRNG